VGTLAISVRRATSSDAAELAALVNRAFEAERTFVDGDRTNATEIEDMTERGSFLVLEHDDGLAAAIYVERRGRTAYFGMLSVRPELQGLGLGTRLVRIAEALGEALGASEMTLRIVNLREELARWYKSLGYREIGTAPYEHREVKRPCHFVDLAKDLPGSTGVSVALGAA
jgi:ribosomal protein S18 acetylase RimI-like enzyme